MKEKTSDKGFAEYWTDLDKKIDILEKSQDIDVSTTATNIRKDLKELKTGVRGLQIAASWLALLAILLLIFFILIGTNNRTFKNLISSDYELMKDSILGITDADQSLHYEEHNGKVLPYPKLLTIKDSIDIENSRLKSDLELCRLKLKWAKEDSANNVKYRQIDRDRDKIYSEINKKIEETNENYDKQVDSAFILLKIFRNRMTYDKASNTWTVKTN